MSTDLSGTTIAFLVAPEGVEQVELTEPWKAVQEAGGIPQLVSTDSGRIQAFHHLDKGDTFPVDVTVDAASYAGLVLPGGSPTRTSCGRSRRPSPSPRRSSTPASRSR